MIVKVEAAVAPPGSEVGTATTIASSKSLVVCASIPETSATMSAAVLRNV